jgi:hypothetical protein
MTYLWPNYFLLSEVLNLGATESLSCGWTNQTGVPWSSARRVYSSRGFPSLSLREKLEQSLWLPLRLLLVFLHHSPLSSSIIHTFHFLNIISSLALLYLYVVLYYVYFLLSFHSQFSLTLYLLFLLLFLSLASSLQVLLPPVVLLHLPRLHHTFQYSQLFIFICLIICSESPVSWRKNQCWPLYFCSSKKHKAILVTGRRGPWGSET